MKKAILKFVWIYILFMIVFIFMKPIFMIVYYSVIHPSLGDWWQVIRHGMAMDRSVAGYLSVIPGLIIAAETVTSPRICERILNIYMGIATVLIALIYCLDLGLYGTWGFRLDMTPVFYFTTSPLAAMASMQWWHWFAGVIGMAAISAGIWLLYRISSATIHLIARRDRQGWLSFGVMILLTALLFIPIRGSFTVSSMNPSRAYFSNNQRLNHAAINPLFSLLYSATHQGHFDRMYDFMSTDEADEIIGNAMFTGVAADNDSIEAPAQILRTDRPDIVLVILESFSSHLLPSQGGEPVATGLDSVAREGVLFTDIYASSFRTDRALPAILSGFPAPTSTSLLKYVNKFEHLPSLPSILGENGYDLTYYYGGDINFTNMQAYLISMGFSEIISDKDFPADQRESKWGAHDGVLFNRALEGIRSRAEGHKRGVPQLSVIQTSSSHEPFEVPYTNPRFADVPQKNAFAYTDSCLTAFLNDLRSVPGYEHTLVVILPDHYGCWPLNLAPVDRHHIPVVVTGGALIPRGITVNRLASQSDLAATLLAQMNIPSDDLRYSRNILSPASPPIAVFTEPSLIGIITPGDTLIYNPDAEAVISSTPDTKLIPVARAMMKSVYTTVDNL